jgi:hypothetical protein
MSDPAVKMVVVQPRERGEAHEPGGLVIHLR